MSRIQVGMMVRVVQHPRFINMNMKWTIGKVREVKEPGYVKGTWRLQGLEYNHNGVRMAFLDCVLEPFRPDSDPSTWEEVQSITGWCPMETVK